MRITKTLGALLLATAGAAVLWGIARGNPASTRWGSDAHRMATRAATGTLPEGIPLFFREAGPQLEYLSPEPDRWYNRDLAAMDEAWRYDHFIDLEEVPPGALNEPDRYEFLTALFEAGLRRPQETVGFLPFRILELYQRLATGFAHWRLASPGPNRDWMESRIINDAGLLGHYAVDASNPHHTTIHFNGWAEGTPNPRGFTTDRDFHSRFESGFIRAHVAFEDLPPLIPSSPRRLRNPRTAIWDYLQDTHGTVEEMYQLEKDHGFDPERPPHPEAREFAIQRLATGAEMLAAIWWSTWLESDEIADEIRARRRRP